MIRAVIFDLDNCLSAASEHGADLFAPVFAAVRQANQGTLTDAALERAFDDCWHESFDVVAQRHGFSEEMLRAGSQAYAALEVREPMTGYDDLNILAELPAPLFLVTTGFRRLQASKIRALGINHLFSETHIDALDEAGRRGKRLIFESILERHGFKADEVLVVGDNADSEIEAGRQLGMPTVQILRPGVSRSANAAQHVRGLAEIKQFVTDNLTMAERSQ
jgi:putative hydrolase of the HAD superfamily